MCIHKMEPNLKVTYFITDKKSLSFYQLCKIYIDYCITYVPLHGTRFLIGDEGTKHLMKMLAANMAIILSTYFKYFFIILILVIKILFHFT